MNVSINEKECNHIQRAIDHAERRTDELVYELHGLTEEEEVVAIVEGVSSKH